MFRRSFSVFVQYFRGVLKNEDNEQVGKPAICDVFVCKQKQICDVFIICLLFFRLTKN